MDSLSFAVVESLWLIQEQSLTQQQDSAESCGSRNTVQISFNVTYTITTSTEVQRLASFVPSSLACDRNFSVVKRGFFSSRIRFQKDASFASKHTRQREQDHQCDIRLKIRDEVMKTLTRHRVEH